MTLIKCSIGQIIDRIRRHEPFEAVDDYYGFYLKIDTYVPHVSAAIHDGNQMRPELIKKCTLSHEDRLYEEDPYTAYFIDNQPVVIKGLDSRFEYDLNRFQEDAVYETAWGKTVWAEPLSSEEKEMSLEKYRRFYRVIFTLLEELTRLFPDRRITVYDIHSYNYKRWDRQVPEINIGTTQLNSKIWGAEIRQYLDVLQACFPNYWVAENDTFFGKGGFLGQIIKRFPNALVLATEFKKFYCDELTGRFYWEQLADTKERLEQVIKLYEGE